MKLSAARGLLIVALSLSLVVATAGAKERDEDPRHVTDQSTQVKAKPQQDKRSGDRSTTQTTPVEQPAVDEPLPPVTQPPMASPGSAVKELSWYVFSNSGTVGATSQYELVGTFYQNAAGPGSNSTYELNGGFWQTFGIPSCCVGIAGNTDGDPNEVIDVQDITILISFLFLGGTLPACTDEANIDVDPGEIIDITDLTLLINYVFLNDTELPPC